MMRLFDVLVTLFSIVSVSSNPITDSDCNVCKHLVHSGDISKIKEASCRVVQARDEVVDADWKLHSAAMISKDSNALLKEIQNLVSQNIGPNVICGYMGVKSHEGGCVCPMDLEPFKNLGTIMTSVRDSSGSGSTTTDVISALDCPAVESSSSISLLELARKTKMRRSRRTSSKALLMDVEGCGGRRKEEEDDGDTVRDIVARVKPGTGKYKKKADQATGLIMVCLTPSLSLYLSYSFIFVTHNKRNIGRYWFGNWFCMSSLRHRVWSGLGFFQLDWKRVRRGIRKNDLRGYYGKRTSCFNNKGSVR